MNFLPTNIYHVYNRGNNRQNIFFNEGNYFYFLGKIRRHLLGQCDILAYCLMPNHFHLLVYTKEIFENNKMIRSIATILSSYTQAINNQENRVGNLFQQKTKAKLLENNADAINRNVDYALTCLNYIHQNPLRAGLVKNLEDWNFSSFNEFTGIKKNGFCNVTLAKQLIAIGDPEDFYKQSYNLSGLEILDQIFES